MHDIVLISQFFPPESGAGAKRIGAMASALTKQLRVLVMTLKPAYPSSTLYETVDLASFDSDWPGRIRRLFQFRPYRQSQLVRAAAELGMALRMAGSLVPLRAKAFLVSTPSMFLAPCVFLVARIKRSRFVWDLRDLTWRYVRETGEGGALATVLSRILESWMAFVLRRADLVFVTNRGAQSVIVADYGVPAERVRVFTNGVSRQFYEALSAGPVESTGRPVVLYLGLLGRNHGVEVLVDVARLVQQAEFVVVGDGPRRDAMEDAIREDDPGNLKLEGYCIDLDRILDYYRSATILFNHTLDTPTLTEAVLAAKLFEYMATGKPIVSGGSGIPAEFLAEIGCAVVVPPSAPEAIAHAIRELLDDPVLRHEMGNRGRAYVGKQGIREDIMAELTDELARWLSTPSEEMTKSEL